MSLSDDILAAGSVGDWAELNRAGRALANAFVAPGFVAWPHCLQNPSGFAVGKDELLTAIESALAQLEDVLVGDRETDPAGHVRLAQAHVRAAREFYEPIDLGDPFAF